MVAITDRLAITDRVRKVFSRMLFEYGRIKLAPRKPTEVHARTCMAFPARVPDSISRKDPLNSTMVREHRASPRGIDRLASSVLSGQKYWLASPPMANRNRAMETM